MYKLGQQFEMDYESAKAHTSNIVTGSKYRFSVLSERLTV